MAKMFYSLEEAADKLGKSQDEVREMAKEGRLQEFRDRDKLMFKVDQVDLLSGDEGGEDPSDLSSVIPLADSTPGDNPALSDSGSMTDFDMSESDIGGSASSSGTELPLADSVGAGPGGSDSGGDFDISEGESPKQKTGVSIFDADELDDADPSAVTQVSDGGLDDLSLEPVGSGSGLLDLTRESDDTSLGAVDFLEDLSSGDDSSAGGPPSGLFEGGSDEGDVAIPAGAGASPMGGMIAAEPYDGAGSGLVGGLAFGSVAALGLGVTIVLLAMLGALGGLATTVADNLWITVGALAGVTLVVGAVGFVLGNRS
ncbi:MAG: hypothetical protein EA376_04670 [Phycisphaeraceae bacterium]|nr:MAG: hypothetical protein EA376_04670 [Phycisphaeraceae bacterium]